MTDIEIVFDPVGHASTVGMTVNENIEILPDSDWVLWARRFSGVEDLFVYRHKLTQKFVLSKWIYDPKVDGVGIIMELEAFDYPPNWFPPTQDWVRDRLRPSQDIADSVKRGMRDVARSQYRAKRDQIEEKHKVADWVQKQGNEEVASVMRQRKWSDETSPEFESFKEDLQNSAKGRIITGG
jgi:hypothetical protein